MCKKILAIVLAVAMFAALAGCRKNTGEEPTEMTELVTETETEVTEQMVPDETKAEDLSFFDGIELPEGTETEDETVNATEGSDPTEGATEETTETEKESETKPDDSNDGNNTGYVEDGDMLEPPANDSSVELP